MSSRMNHTKKRVAAIITEYWDICHADVVVTPMLEGFGLNGVRYESTLEVVAMYIDQFPDNDIGRALAQKHNIPLYDTIAGAVCCGGDSLAVDGIIIIGEHGEYPENEYRQILYPRKRFFEECLDVMLASGRVVPVYSDKGFAVTKEEVKWMYEQVKEHQVPFMSSSVVPFARQLPDRTQVPPQGAPIERMLGLSWDGVDEAPERYTYHTLEMLQSIAEQRAYGETGIARVRAFEGEQAIERMLSQEWSKLYNRLAGFMNLLDPAQFPYRLVNPMFFEVDYVDGLIGGIIFADQEIKDFASVYQKDEESDPYCIEFRLQEGKPYSHFSTLVLAIERFMHTGNPPFPVERSYLTTGALEALMQSLYEKKEVETPYLKVSY